MTKFPSCWYASTRLHGEALDRVLYRVYADAGLVPRPGLPAGVEVVRRGGGEASWLFVVNHGEQDVELAATGTEQLSGARCDTALRVPAGGVRILRGDPTP